MFASTNIVNKINYILNLARLRFLEDNRGLGCLCGGVECVSGVDWQYLLHHCALVVCVTMCGTGPALYEEYQSGLQY